MSSFDLQDFGFEEPPPRPETPPIRRGFVLILFVLCIAALLVYGIPYVADRTGYAWEAGRSRAASEALAKLDREGVVGRASELFRMATTAVSPAVVNVQSLRERRGGGPLIPGVPLGVNEFSRGQQSRELGSGVIIDKKKGYVVTNYHVVKEADQIVVQLGPGDDVRARLVGADPKTDLAVLQVRSSLQVEAEWGDSDKLDIGDWVLAIGSPLGFDHSVTAGIVSATERNDIRLADYESFIQTDAAINPGNSGGPLVDLSGKVVGINTAIITQSGGYEGIGLAIPASLARRVVENLIKDGKVVRGYLGVRLKPVNTEMARKLNLNGNRGALVVEVQPRSPAEQAGLKVNDVLTNLNGHEVTNPAGLRNLTANLDVGLKVPLVYYRDGKSSTVEVKIAELPASPEVASLGFTVRERPSSEAKGSDVIVEIDQVVSAGPGYRAGLRPRMRILGVDQTPIHTLAEFESAVRGLDLRNGLPLIIQTPDGRAGSVRVGGEPPAHP
jgi:serine protease Do